MSKVIVLSIIQGIAVTILIYALIPDVTLARKIVVLATIAVIITAERLVT